MGWNSREESKEIMLARVKSPVFINTLAVVGVLLSLTRAIGLGLELVPASFYYFLWAGLALGSIGRLVRLSRPHILFVLIALFSILLNEVDAVFQAEYRLMSFGVMLMAIGGLNQSPTSIVFRGLLFRYLSVTLVALTVMSFILYPLRLPLLFHSNGLYKGLFNHSMLLGPVAGFSALLCLFDCLYPRKKIKLHPKLSIIMLIVSLLTLLLSGSRGALLSVFIGIIVLLYKRYSHQKVKLFKISALATMGLLVSAPIWYPYTEQVRLKQKRNLEAGGTFQSREKIWEDRWREFEHNPILGSGFASMNKDLIKSKLTSNEQGGVEPGSSWLFLLSSMGLLGLISFLYVGVRPWIKFLRLKNIYNDPTPWLLLSILSMLFIHMFLEGYIISSGSFLFLYLWLCIGLLPCSIQSTRGIK